MNLTHSEKLALFLGMLSGDGCLIIGHNGGGYRNYPIDFCNTEKEKVLIFQKLFFELFNLEANIHFRDRPNRKRIWSFRKYSVKVYNELKDLGFPEGVKRDILRVPNIIKNGTNEMKLYFIHGVIITDGHVGKDRILFHSGSNLFLQDLSLLISEFISSVKPVKEYVQREIYKSYQLCLNNKEKDDLLSEISRRGTMVLRLS